jgi:hypothetical protein
MRRPVDEPYAITTEFGVPDSAALYGRHSGVDYAKGTGSSVFAPVTGVVTDYVYGPYHGNVVQILADDGKFHRLMHNSKLLVSPGQRVSEGQEVAKSGATGQGVTGPHVHWDIATEKYPSSFAAFYSPASLLFGAQSPIPTPPPLPQGQNLVGRVLYLHPVNSWRVYRPNEQPKGVNAIGFLAPVNFDSGLKAPRDRGLTYTIVGQSQFPNTVIIDTKTYGRVAIYVDQDGEII